MKNKLLVSISNNDCSSNCIFFFVKHTLSKFFVEPANLLSSGFTGVAILIDRITSLYGFNFSTSLGLIV